VSTPEIDRLLQERSLTREVFDADVVVSLWNRAMALLSDASAPGLSTDGAFQLVYTAVLQATFAVLAAHGLRVNSTANHYRAFYTLQKLDRGLEGQGRLFDEMRATRHISVYEPTRDPAEVAARLVEARALVPGALAALREVVIAPSGPTHRISCIPFPDGSIKTPLSPSSHPPALTARTAGCRR